MLLNTDLLHLSDFITCQMMFPFPLRRPCSLSLLPWVSIGPTPECVCSYTSCGLVLGSILLHYYVSLVVPGTFFFIYLLLTRMPCRQAPAAASLSEPELQKWIGEARTSDMPVNEGFSNAMFYV